MESEIESERGVCVCVCARDSMNGSRIHSHGTLPMHDHSLGFACLPSSLRTVCSAHTGHTLSPFALRASLRECYMSVHTGHGLPRPADRNTYIEQSAAEQRRQHSVTGERSANIRRATNTAAAAAHRTVHCIASQLAALTRIHPERGDQTDTQIECRVVGPDSETATSHMFARRSPRSRVHTYVISFIKTQSASRRPVKRVMSVRLSAAYSPAAQ